MRHVACMVDMKNSYLKDVQCHNTGTFMKGTINHLKTEVEVEVNLRQAPIWDPRPIFLSP
jgi:hypothetical protein